jgi:hypothetical protein
MAWQNGKLANAVIRSLLGNNCEVRLGEKTVSFPTKAGKLYRLDGELKSAEL